MTLIHKMSAAHGMDDQTWARHANPLSGWTRMPVLPLLALAIWSRAWIGWACLVPIAALMVWTWINPRAFPPPAHQRAWMTRAVLGERLWLAAGTRPIPAHHAVWARTLAGAAGLGLPPLVWGLWAFDPWAVLAGLVLTVGAKLWFLDRMVWLHDDMTRMDR